MLNAFFRPLQTAQLTLKSALCGGLITLNLWALFRIMGQAISMTTCDQVQQALQHTVAIPFFPVFTVSQLLPFQPASILWLCNYTSVGVAVLMAAVVTAICVTIMLLVARWNPQRSFYRARLRYKIHRIQVLARELSSAIDLTDLPDLESFFNDDEIRRLRRIAKLRPLAESFWDDELDPFTF